MEKYIPYEKLSKKKRRELDTRRRGSWNGFSPVTRRPENPKAYNRQKARKRSDDFPDRAFFFQKNFNILKKIVPFFEVFCYDSINNIRRCSFETTAEKRQNL